MTASIRQPLEKSLLLLILAHYFEGWKMDWAGGRAVQGSL
jgi:hypothetical protein